MKVVLGWSYLPTSPFAEVTSRFMRYGEKHGKDISCGCVVYKHVIQF